MQKQILCFATNNLHKLEEVAAVLPNHFQIKTLKDISCFEELPENQNTIAGNAEEKARYVFDHYQVPCFADDTGLEVEALWGAPGVHTAHYAGPQRDAGMNMSLLLHNLKNAENRSARFITVICLILDGKPYFFEGEVKGHIAHLPAGNQGFGYDPIFIPEGFDQTFAQLGPEVKLKLSHRSRAIQKMVDFLGSNF